ncbi:MAG: transcriptional regulator [Actinomycetota bacterium]
MTHPSNRLDNAVHQRTRLGILTVLAGADRVEFTYLRETLALTDGNLSRNLTVLETAGFIAIEKGFEGRRSRTWVTATPAGQQALADEISALREIVKAVEQNAGLVARGVPRPGPALP